MNLVKNVLKEVDASMEVYLIWKVNNFIYIIFNSKRLLEIRFINKNLHKMLAESRKLFTSN